VALGFYFFVVLNDWVSSIIAAHSSVPGLHETNGFVRDAALHFVLWKGFVVDGIYFVAISIAAYLAYHCLCKWNEPLARIASAGVFIYFSFDRFVEAVIPNYLYVMHLHVDDPRKIEDLFRICSH
jgi:hypothetical protein